MKLEYNGDECRLLVTGSIHTDRDLVYKELTEFMFPENDVILYASVMTGMEYNAKPYDFPLAVDWLRRMWFRSLNKKRYSTVVQMHAPKNSKKKLKGKEVWFSPKYIRGLLKKVTHVVVFWNVGNVPLRDMYIWEIAERYNLKRKRILV